MTESTETALTPNAEPVTATPVEHPGIVGHLKAWGSWMKHDIEEALEWIKSL